MGDRPWPKPGQPFYTEQDTEDALEYFREKSLECDGCGRPRDETMLKENSWAYKAEPVVCHACAERDRVALQHSRKEHNPHGLMFSVYKREETGSDSR